MMALPKPRRISQLERDLRKYATQKAYTLIADVAQAYDIAGLPITQCAACLGALFLRLSTQIAVETAVAATPKCKEVFLRHCGEVYDRALEMKDKSQPRRNLADGERGRPGA